MRKELAWLIIGLMTIIVSATNSQIVSTENAEIATYNIKATQEKICTQSISQNDQETTTKSTEVITQKVAKYQ